MTAAALRSEHTALVVCSGLVAFSAATLVGLRLLDRRDGRRAQQLAREIRQLDRRAR